jgi:hypothetical protein
MTTESVLSVFSLYVSGRTKLTEEHRSLLCEEARRQLGGRELDGTEGDPFKMDLHFQQLRAAVGTSLWDLLSAEERITLFYPYAKDVGAVVELPKRGKGEVVRRELTKRLGLEMVFRLSDGNLFAWEFFD